MADVILSPVIQVVFESLISTIKNKVAQVRGVEQELENLSKTLSTIMAVVEDAEEKQVKNRGVRDWLKDIKDAAYEIENILDEYNIEASRWKAKHTTECHNIQVSNFLPCVCFSKVAFRSRIGNKIRDINERLRKIAELRSAYDLRVGVSEKVVEIRETGSFVDESTVLGRKYDKERIVDLLLSSADEDSRDDVSVIPIIGMGGLGKTTLAQLVYNDERVEKNFQLRMWVCVSVDFEIKRLVKEIIESGTGKPCEPMNFVLLQDCLHKTLIGRRFLLVLDDVWNDDQNKWETLMDHLRSGAKGSRIIVTTRNEKASPTTMCTSHPVRLECLSEGDCWSLFAQRAFGHRIEEPEPKLIEIGQEIVKKCKGLPLAAQTLGSLMHFKRNETEWLEVIESETWTLWKDEEDGILNALRISYNHLPVHLKQCFIYCSIYPTDHEIQKEELIKLWMAHGFIQPYMRNDKQLEDIGTDHFNDLLWRSFFRDVKRDDVGNILSCKIHDLLHDFAQYIAMDECSIIQLGHVATSANKTYHLSSPAIPDRLYRYSNLRTFLLLPPTDRIPEHLVDLFLNLGCLRALDLSCCKIDVLPDSIGNLKHLRYLNLRGNYIEELPETTSNLCNLQTLNIKDCHHSLTKLPKCMKNMTSLRHLEMDDNDYGRIKHMPKEIGKLTCLQTLPLYIVGKENGCGLGELQDLNLRGTLRIRNLENIKNMEEAKKANLKRKQHLHTLKFCWEFGRVKNNAQEEEGVLEGLEPHTNLRSLSIENYGGSKFPTWMRNSSLTNLESISLVDCSSCECLPPFAKLQLLKELRICGMGGVKYLRMQEFPSLEELILTRLHNLEDWLTSGEVNLCCLCKLLIWDCPKLRALPELPLLEELNLKGMPGLENFPTSGEGNSSPLSKLYIENCPKLRAFPQLTNLIELSLTSCDQMLSLENLPSSLKLLEIKKCGNITSLPDGLLQNLTALECLELNEMANITSLPKSIENLAALKRFKIHTCPKLESLPERLNHLSALQTLSIYRCPIIRKRCREGGEDWHKIAHVRHKDFDPN